MSDSRRGFIPSDVKEFDKNSLILLRKAQKDLLYLLEQGYPIKNATTFIGNHYLLSERQRLAIIRATAEPKVLDIRRKKQFRSEQVHGRVCIDGLNTIITLEVLLSEGTLIRCMDTALRDLAGLRGTYRLIEETNQAIRLIGDKLARLDVQEAVFYLDSPVSNTGRLKQRLQELLEGYPFQTEVMLVHNADIILQEASNVITSDAIILNRCESWYNLTAEILKDVYLQVNFVDLSNLP